MSHSGSFESLREKKRLELIKENEMELKKWSGSTNCKYEIDKYEQEIRKWATDSPHARPRTLVHCGMVCKAWRQMSRIRREPRSSAMALIEVFEEEGRWSQSRSIRVAMRSCIISEGKEDVFAELLALWIEKEGAKAVKDELKEICDWNGELFPDDDSVIYCLTLLHMAADHGRAKIASLLIEAGAGEGLRAGSYDLGVGMNEGEGRVSPVFWACGGRTEGHSRVLKLLIENGASVLPEARSSYPYSFLHRAVMYNCFQNVRILVNAGSNPRECWIESS